ncbi:high affinity cAMP-specific and IBMX-insensitive 3',5'-cyclic phosphodiesterase 8B isoform X3 [Rhipicephalus microplus]|uniref:high affinity cAMP-specific and IBMX-insensitive 3',5'-cyclic phosphodiesterase 8B isoform X3 n=1 Tax=Rhipicephalus microplus TaxID=6941 RepID=UPI003F6D1DA9
MAPSQDGLHDADAKYKIARERLVLGQEAVAFKIGSMYLTLPTVRVMFVFTKEDAQYEALTWAAEKMHYACSLSTTTEEAIENFFNERPHLVFIDARGKGTMDPTALCRTMRGNRGSQFSCIVAVVKKALVDKEEAAIVSLLKYGFSRWLTETCSHGVCLNEMIQIEHNDLANLRKLEASEALFSALHFTRDGVIVTGPSHDVQFMNHAAERLVGYTAEELLGENAQELHRTGALKAEVAECIIAEVYKGHAWQGTLFQRRRSGECVPVWSKIAPVNITGPGQLEHVVYVKENPFLMDRPFSPDAAGSNKRQAYAAKYHAMTIEGPVTKVVNMLMATKDNCAASVGQSLDRVIDILKSTELYNPQLSASMGKAEDQITSDLVAGLTSTGQKPTGVRRLSHETALMKVNVVKAASSSTATHGCLSPSLAAAPSRIRELLENDVKWDLDIIELESHTARRPLIWLGMSIFAKFSVHTSLECDDTILSNWLQLIESHYQDNPYHNSTHAADVMQATAYFLLRLRSKDILDPLDEAICLLSAVIHDVDHPGRSTPFLCNSQDLLAILYNDRSVLEFHHAAFGFKLTLSDEKVNIFQNMERDVYRTVRASIIDMVLATEMTKHFEHLSKFLNAFQKPAQDDDAFGPEQSTQDQGEFGSLRSPESIVLIKRMLIKCADVSNPARPIELCKQWAQRIAEEYCSQTDEEKRRGLPVMMPAFDRATVNIAKSQTGFISYFVRDMFKAWSGKLASLPPRMALL